ncbi:Uncharacterized GTP-binding protein YjiA [Bordetella ansorpii]|uniref:Uncharacterized GTP-binding protein YjiA n=1 Tax=Bordetella ansorpii TaxID=288768 RepID=A0A157SCQ2_9BORD|nr:GTP-binding protein [Bordetella ansorpii]SAI68013.1 Uncharacterized GTP-binding protein YjiA [Bordetella ansorpii]
MANMQGAAASAAAGAAAGAGPIPVYLLTGFLGSGKTTLLSRLVRSAAFADTAVIINEFGQVGLDHRLLGKASDEDTVLLDSGCLCCALNSSLQDGLESLYYRRLRGEIPPYARMVVETSGLADPAPLVNTLAGDASVARHYRFAGVIATIDAVHGLATLDAYREASAQAAVADVLIVTKTDLCDAQQLARVRQALAALNATAQVRLASAGTSEGEDRFFDGIPATGRLPVRAPGQPPATPLAHVLRYGIASYILRVDRPVSWNGYARWVAYLQRHGGERVLRVKAILDFADGERYAIHGVRHLFSPPHALGPADPAAPERAIVVIAQDMSADEVGASLEALQSSG